MSKTISYTVYDVMELQGKARDKALQFGREMASPDSCIVTEDLKAYAEENYGVKVDKCYWSLSYCQGDGVAFYGDLDLDIFCKNHPEFTYLLDNGFRVNVYDCNHHYHHYNTMAVEIDGEGDCPDDACNGIRSILRECSKACEQYGYELLEITDEHAIDTLQLNEVYFHADGTVVERGYENVGS